MRPLKIPRFCVPNFFGRVFNTQMLITPGASDNGRVPTKMGNCGSREGRKIEVTRRRLIFSPDFQSADDLNIFVVAMLCMERSKAK